MPCIHKYKQGKFFGFMPARASNSLITNNKTTGHLLHRQAKFWCCLHVYTFLIQLTGGLIKKLQRQLQRKLHTKIQLCVKLSLLRLFHVVPVVQNMRSALSLAWHE